MISLAVQQCQGCQQICKITYGKASCQCLPGYRLVDKRNCIDINECEEKNPCGSNSKCVNTQGSFYCDCDSGYELKNATHCSDINECKTGDACQQNCHNILGSYFCTCDKGLKNNGSICIDINECKITNKGGCSHGCENTYGSYNCTCPTGMKLSSNNHTCVSTVSTKLPSTYFPLPSSSLSSSTSPQLEPDVGRQKEGKEKNTDGVLAGIIAACIRKSLTTDILTR